uniref:Uncharacterized protein n=1 Tax=Pipistrellus kuhlii TaxID=59472 RepID=A0A7J7YMV0_PIPKU|nr:hypothetical protein mPipKuh1_010136 [Pipistrellus kuhlii]
MFLISVSINSLQRLSQWSKSHDKSKITQNSYEFKGITSCVLLQFQSNQELYNYVCSILTCSRGCQFLAYWREHRCQRVARLLPAVPVHTCSLREVVLGESTSSLPSIGEGGCESGRPGSTGTGKERAGDGERVRMRENTRQADMQRAGKKA